MRMKRGISISCILFILCLSDFSHFSDARLDFWNAPKQKPTHDLNPNKFSPVILIPGCGGNKLQARLNKAVVPNILCYKNEDYFDLWLNPLEMFPLIIDCWVDNIRLYYNNFTRKTQNTPGVETKLPEWSRTDALEWIDTTPVIDNYDFGAYFYHIADALANRGYVRGETLFGAPYDFRKGPNENKEWFSRLKELVEYSYKINDNTGVTFIVHSMGGKMMLYFLQQMPQEWKDKYVKQMITLSVPWGGSVQAIQALSVGYDFGSIFLQNAKMQQVQSTCPSVAWLLPSVDFWKPDEVVATMKNKNYTSTNIDEFFYDINNPNIPEMRKDLAPYNNFTAPGVDLHCLYGSNVGDTVDRLDFGASFTMQPTLIKGNGDGTVNKRSLIGCGYFAGTPPQANHKVYQQDFQGVEHYNMLSHPGTINYILSQLTGKQDYPRDYEISNSTTTMKIRLF